MEASLEPASSSAAAPPQLRGALASEASQGRCAHCDSPTPSTADPYCCTGCRHVHELLQGQGLARYYELRSGRGVPVLDRARSLGEDAWVELELAKLDTSRGLRAVPLDVEGLHCTGCVWLIQEVFHRQACPGNVTVNPALGTLELSIEPGFPLKAFADQLAAFGYRLGPRRKAGERASDDLVWRIGVCVAIAMNAMIFAIARYAGLEGGSLEHVFMWLELGLAVVAFMVGGVVFVRAAWRGLAKRMVHLDLPIAVGLVLGYAGSFAAVLAGKGKGSFFDTLIVFTTLMLVGRFLRERVLEKNRSQLLEDAGIEGLFCRRIEEGEVHVVPVTSIAAGDRLLVAPGDVVPVSALASEAGSFSFDWVTGESEARQVGPGDRVDAGGANAGQVALQLTAEEPFSDSRLLSLLRAPRAAHRYGDSASPFEARVATLWVPAVLAAAAAGFGLHLALGAAAQDALTVAVSVLVVTCPCAFGIATPIANELVLGGLRKRGLLIRSASFLERALSVRRVVFDKTGTLTSGQLRLADAGAVTGLPAEEREVLYNLAARSSHPKAAAIKAAIPAESRRFDAGATVVEVAGVGLELVTPQAVYRLGAPTERGPDADVTFERDARVLASFKTLEELRPDAASEVRALTADGLEIWMATGDSEPRARAVAASCYIPEARVLAAQSPEQKAALIHQVDRGDTLMIGDGVNDGPAVQAAHCSGTPAAGRAFLASRADFYLLSSGLGPVRTGLAAAHALRRTLRRNLGWAALYNVGALGLAYAGLMTPLLCAVLMPLSSLVSIALVTSALGSKGSVWRS
jgi:Cu2+-exporting ATPase